MSPKNAASRTLTVTMQWLAVLPMLLWPAFAHSNCCCVGRSITQSECRQTSSGVGTSSANQLEGAPRLTAMCPHCGVNKQSDVEAVSFTASDVYLNVDYVASLPSESVDAVCQCVIETPSETPAETTGLRAATNHSVYSNILLLSKTPLFQLRSSSTAERDSGGGGVCCTSAERCAWNCRWLN